MVSRLALRELERAAGLGAAVFLALDHARVARQEAAALERRTQIRLEVSQRLRDAVTHGAGLAGEAATGHGADHVILTAAISSDNRLLDHHAQHRTCEE